MSGIGSLSARRTTGYDHEHIDGECMICLSRQVGNTLSARQLAEQVKFKPRSISLYYEVKLRELFSSTAGDSGDSIRTAVCFKVFEEFPHVFPSFATVFTVLIEEFRRAIFSDTRLTSLGPDLVVPVPYSTIYTETIAERDEARSDLAAALASIERERSEIQLNQAHLVAENAALKQRIASLESSLAKSQSELVDARARERAMQRDFSADRDASAQAVSFQERRTVELKAALAHQDRTVALLRGSHEAVESLRAGLLSHPLRKADDSEIARLVATAKTAAESAAKESLRREYVREHAVPDTRDTLVVPPLTENDTFPKYQPPSHTVQQLSASSAATVEVSIGGTATSGGTSGATATTISGSGAALAATAASTAGGATAAVSVGGSEGGGRGKTVTAARLLYEQMQAMHAQLVGEYEDALATNTMTVRRWDLKVLESEFIRSSCELQREILLLFEDTMKRAGVDDPRRTVSALRVPNRRAVIASASLDAGETFQPLDQSLWHCHTCKATTLLCEHQPALPRVLAVPPGVTHLRFDHPVTPNIPFGESPLTPPPGLVIPENTSLGKTWAELVKRASDTLLLSAGRRTPISRVMRLIYLTYAAKMAADDAAVKDTAPVSIREVFFKLVEERYCGVRHVALAAVGDVLTTLDLCASTELEASLFAKALEGDIDDAAWMYVIRIKQALRRYSAPLASTHDFHEFACTLFPLSSEAARLTSMFAASAPPAITRTSVIQFFLQHAVAQDDYRAVKLQRQLLEGGKEGAGMSRGSFSAAVRRLIPKAPIRAVNFRYEAAQARLGEMPSMQSLGQIAALLDLCVALSPDVLSSDVASLAPSV